MSAAPPPFQVKTGGGATLTLEGKPMASGGEGAVHRIQGQKQNCVKILKQNQHLAAKERKIRALVELYRHHPPTGSTFFHGCWPTDVVLQNKAFVGFVMPLAPDGSILLYELTRGKLAQKLPSGWQSRYNRKNSKSIESRLKICLNLAAAVHYVHSLNAYTFVDLQPKNILVTEDGRVSLIDLDSMQIAPSGKVLFPARVTTPDYAPAEYIDFSKSYVPPSWDRFALAVVFYEILCGIHPYAGTFGGPHQHITNCTEAIKADLFVWGKHQGSVAVRPAPHDQFTALPDGLQRLFHRAFTSNASNRPKAEEWGQALFTSVSGQKSAAPVITKSAPQPQPVKTTQPTAAPPLKQAGDNFLTWLVLVLAILGALFLVVQKPATTSPTVVYTDKGAEK